MISVILCTYNRAALLANALQSVEQIAVPPSLRWELILVDNNSDDETRQVADARIQKGHIPLRYLFERRQGKSFALNTGIEAARGDILAFTDDDALVDPNWLRELQRAFAQFDCVGIGGRILPVWKDPCPSWLSDEPFLMAVLACLDLGHAPRRMTTPPYGANMAFRKWAFEKYGTFRTDLGPTKGQLIRGEDSEFCRRLLDAGETLMYAPAAVVRHFVESDRTRKGYFLAWCYGHGRSLTRTAGAAKTTSCYFGVPRYLLRNAAESSLRWTLSLDPASRFKHKLSCWRIAGEIAESFALARKAADRQ